jgi:protein TonB
MNVYVPSAAYPLTERWRETPALGEFARGGAAPHGRTNTRLAGIIAVLAIHALVLAAYVFAGPAFVRTETRRMLTVVSVLAEPPKPEPPPPLPNLAPPVVYVPVPIVPEIQLTVPPPPRETITIPLAPAIPSPPDAPFVPAGPPPPPPKPALSATSQAAFAARLFAHLNRFKRYPEGAKLRHQEGIVSLRFTMDRNGRVLAFDIAKSSGSAALDGEARELIQRAQPLPTLPVEFGRETLDLVVPVEFSLH